MALSSLQRHLISFAKRNGIHHKMSAPYHPSTNGEAEQFVQTFKSSMRAEELEQFISSTMSIFNEVAVSPLHTQLQGRHLLQ